jgi:hypothetical protein
VPATHRHQQHCCALQLDSQSFIESLLVVVVVVVVLLLLLLLNET